MKEFQFTCPRCSQRFRCDLRLARRKLPCPRCGRQLALIPKSEIRLGEKSPLKPAPNHDTGLNLP